MISVFTNNAGPYVLIVDKEGDAYTTFVSTNNRSPVLALDAATATVLREPFEAMLSDPSLREAAERLIDPRASGMSADQPGIGRITEIQPFGDRYILVAADHASSLHITDIELVAFFRGVESLVVADR